MAEAMIHPFNNATQTRWEKGEFKVQLLLPENTRPMGFCDGTAADRAELQAIADAENSPLSIEVKVLKTGREIWTLRGSGGGEG
jgi:hypothetical protein